MSSIEWIGKAVTLVEPMINARLVAFCETFDFDAIHELDSEGGRANITEGYWTNLCVKTTSLFQNDNSLLNDIVNLYVNSFPSWIDKTTFRALSISGSSDEASQESAQDSKTLISRLGLKEEIEVAPDVPLIIVDMVHSQGLVRLWRKYAAQVEMVIVIHGASYKHIWQDLKLPGDRYAPLINTEILRAVNPEIRVKVIPEKI